MADRFVVVGLGNPGPKYAGNRHNAGFMVADLLASDLGQKFRAHKGRVDVAEGQFAGVPVTLVKPKAFMNLSGGPVASIRDFYKVKPDHIVVVHDELDIPFGAIRLKQGGGDNGHNGLRSITSALGTREYVRIRFGIGRPPGQQDPADFVLKDFSTVERRELPYLVQSAADAIELLLSAGLAAAQNKFHAQSN